MAELQQSGTNSERHTDVRSQSSWPTAASFSRVVVSRKLRPETTVKDYSRYLSSFTHVKHRKICLFPKTIHETEVSIFRVPTFIRLFRSQGIEDEPENGGTSQLRSRQESTTTTTTTIHCSSEKQAR